MRHVRAALVNVARAYGGIAVLASVIGVPAQTLWRLTGLKGQHPSAIAKDLLVGLVAKRGGGR